MPISGRRTKPAKQDVTARLITAFKEMISDGTVMPGQKLPPERDLAESFGVARSSLRQALKVLEIMGVISQRVGDGTYLNNGAAAILGEPMEFLILLDGITFHELMEARLLVEPELTARAAERANKEDIDELRLALTSMEDARGDHDRFVAQDVLFHHTIFRIAANRVCGLMFTVIHQSMAKLIHLTSQVVPEEHTLALHRRIFHAIRKRDPDEARRRMTEHLVDARGLLLRAAEKQAHVGIRSRAKQAMRVQTLG
jgi:GntR family transcriptional repressor for pyruvate dehydrogenase complex